MKSIVMHAFPDFRELNAIRLGFMAMNEISNPPSYKVSSFVRIGEFLARIPSGGTFLKELLAKAVHDYPSEIILIRCSHKSKNDVINIVSIGDALAIPEHQFLEIEKNGLRPRDEAEIVDIVLANSNNTNISIS